MICNADEIMPPNLVKALNASILEWSYEKGKSCLYYPATLLWYSTTYPKSLNRNRKPSG